MHSQLKEIDMNVSNLQEKRDHYQKKLKNLQELDASGTSENNDRKKSVIELKELVDNYNIGIRKASQIWQA